MITPEKYFYKDVFAWIPELLFPDFQQPKCLTCGDCQLTSHASYSFREVFALHETYFIFSGRVKCSECEKKALRIRMQADELRSERERELLKNSSPQYTFHTTDLEYLKSLPHERGARSSRSYRIAQRLHVHGFLRRRILPRNLVATIGVMQIRNGPHAAALRP
jgi:hypothetical protein